MKKENSKLFLLMCGLAMFFAIPANGEAMHIMEGYLQPQYCVLWGAICVPFIIGGFISIKKILDNNRKVLMILVMAGAFAFVLSSLKIPSVTGSSSHPTGTELGAILFGPWVMSVLGVIVLLFQAILLAHGGITTLGANTFSMAIAGPFLAYGIYKLGEKLKLPKTVSIFLAACLGDLFTYVITSFQLALAHPSAVNGIAGSFAEFFGIFAITQVPLAIIEGLVTVAVMKGLESFAAPELSSLGYFKNHGKESNHE